jgi:hypothetical protein
VHTWSTRWLAAAGALRKHTCSKPAGLQALSGTFSAGSHTWQGNPARKGTGEWKGVPALDARPSPTRHTWIAQAKPLHANRGSCAAACDWVRARMLQDAGPAVAPAAVPTRRTTVSESGLQALLLLCALRAAGAQGSESIVTTHPALGFNYAGVPRVVLLYLLVLVPGQSAICAGSCPMPQAHGGGRIIRCCCVLDQLR